MSEETAEEFWARVGLGHVPISLEEAQAAYDAAEPIPLSDSSIAGLQDILDGIKGIPPLVDRSEWG